MQRRLDALHPLTLMIKKPLLQIINCYLEWCVPKSHLKRRFLLGYAEFTIANKLPFIGMFL